MSAPTGRITILSAVFTAAIPSRARQYGQRAPHWQCAGCHEPIGGLPPLDLADGNRVHLDQAHGLDCLLSFGERWRAEATAGLRPLGLDPPSDFDAL
jgi:hypothetical protein